MSTWVVVMTQQQSGGRHDDRTWPPPGVEFEVTAEEGEGLVRSHTAVKIRELKADRPPHVPAPAPVSMPAETAAGPVPPGAPPGADDAHGPAAPEPEAEADEAEPPKPGDPKQDWYDWAVTQGYTGSQDDITKADLMSRYGGRL